VRGELLVEKLVQFLVAGGCHGLFQLGGTAREDGTACGPGRKRGHWMGERGIGPIGRRRRGKWRNRRYRGL
jgi:hypothetical protein